MDERPQLEPPQPFALRAPRQIVGVERAAQLGTVLALRTNKRHSHGPFVGIRDAPGRASHEAPWLPHAACRFTHRLSRGTVLAGFPSESGQNADSTDAQTQP